jgi:hypothetical protein
VLNRKSPYTRPGTEPEKTLGGTKLNCCSIKTYFTLYCIYFRLCEAIVGLHRIRSGWGARAPPAPRLDPSLYAPVIIRISSTIQSTRYVCPYIKLMGSMQYKAYYVAQEQASFGPRGPAHEASMPNPNTAPFASTI